MNGDGFQDDRSQKGDAIDVAHLSRAIVRRKWWILWPTLAAFVLALIFVTTVSPRYTGVAKVLLENQESYFTRPEKAVPDPTVSIDPEAVQSQAETVATTDLARQAIEKLGLAERDEFNPKGLGNPFGAVLGLLGGRSGAGQDRVVDAFLSHLTVFPVPKSRVLQIEFTSADPALAARGANTVADLYLAQQEQAKKDGARAASSFLSQKIDELRGKVAEAEAKLEAFRANSGLFAGGNGITAPSQQLADLNTQVAAARAKQADAAAKAQSLRTMLREGRLDEVSGVAQDDSLRRYIEQRVALKAQIAEESRTLLPQHPRMKELEGEVAGLDAEIRLAANKAVVALENDAKLAAAQVDSLSGVLSRQSKSVATGNIDEARLRELDLEASTARQQLESYLQKYREALAHEADNAAPADARVIATATEPRTPTFPKKAPTVLLATLAVFLVALGIVTAHALIADGRAEERSEGLDARVEAREPPTGPSMEIAGRAPPEGVDPPDDFDPKSVVDPPSFVDAANVTEAPDCFSSPQAIADHLAEAGRAAGVTALFAGERTSRALPLALSAARNLSKRGRAVLVDLGVSQDWLSDAIDRAGAVEGPLAGLAELLDGRASFEDALHRDLSSRLDIIPAGNGAIEPEALHETLAALATSYQFVVLHASDWRASEVGEALEAVTVFVMVARASRLGAALRHLRDAVAGTSIVTLGLAAVDGRSIERAA